MKNAEVKRLATQRLEHADLSAARTLEELRRLAFGNRVALMRCRTVADLEKLPLELQAMVQDFEVFEANIPGLRDGKTDRARRVRTESKLKALELLAKHFKLLVEQVDVNVFDWDKLAARLQRARTEKRLNP